MIQIFLILWLITTTVFLIGDVPWLYFIMNKFFIPQIQHLMNITQQGTVINYASAFFGYILATAALTWFVIMPLAKAPLMTIFLHGAFLGFCMYGVYEFTNHATLAQWPITFLIIDIMWGTLWCGLASIISVMIARYTNVI